MKAMRAGFRKTLKINGTDPGPTAGADGLNRSHPVSKTAAMAPVVCGCLCSTVVDMPSKASNSGGKCHSGCKTSQ